MIVPVYRRRERQVLLAVVAAFFLLQLCVIMRFNLNWDEYFFLSHIYTHVAERLSVPFQTFHVRLLPWLISLPLSEADQLVAGRLFTMLCEAGSLFCLFRIAREFVSVESALFAVIAWCAAGYALLHGASFRADPLSGFLMMASLALLMCARLAWKEVAAAGALAAIGLLVTIKSVFFLPAFLGALVWRLRGQQSSGAVLRYFAFSAAILLAVFSVLWVLHASSLAAPAYLTAAPPTSSSALSAGTGVLDKVVLSQALFPRADYIVRWVMAGLLSVALCGFGLWSAAKQNIDHSAARPFLPVLLLVAPLLSLVVYRNAFPYFFPFIMLPVAVAAGLGVEAIKRPLLRFAVLIGMAVAIVMSFVVGWQRDQSAQREIADVVHELFPEPVPYIDRNGMLPSFPKAGFLMSTWGIDEYLRGSNASLAQVVARQQPPLLILNSPLLQDAVAPQRQVAVRRLLPGDVEALSSNYIELWGPIWIAGKTLAKGDRNFDILVEGTYTLDCRGSSQIDGIDVPCNGTTYLERGKHRWSGGEATLRWGDRLAAPTRAPPTKPIFHGF
jgi:hypothetical protein